MRPNHPYLDAILVALFREAIRAEACRIDLANDGTISFFDRHENKYPINPDWTDLFDDWEFKEQIAEVLIKHIKRIGGVASPHPFYPQSGAFRFSFHFGGVTEQIGCQFRNTPTKSSDKETLHLSIYLRPWINPIFLALVAVSCPIYSSILGYTEGVSSLYAWIGIVILHIGFLFMPKIDVERRLLGRLIIFILIAHTTLVSFCLGSWIGDWPTSDSLSIVGLPIVGAILMSVASKTHHALKSRGTDTR